MEEMRRLHQSGLLLFLGNDESGMNYAGNPYPFRQDSTFLYFFGLDFPGLAALIDMEDGKVSVYTDELTIDNIVWKGSLPVRELCSRAGVEHTGSMDELRSLLMKAEHKGRMVHFLPPYRGRHYVKMLQGTALCQDVQSGRAAGRGI